MIRYLFISVLTLGFCAVSHAAPGTLVKSSQHASFDPKNFERVAVIVKPMLGGQSRMMSRRGEQGQSERLIEQTFIRTLLGKGYTLVSRADLDAAMVEKGLDAANLTDEKLGQEAGKILHVSAILVVSVDAFSSSSQRQQIARTQSNPRGGSVEFYRVTASLAARLVGINNNMVLWTGDLSVSQNMQTSDQDSIVLSSTAQAIATAFPPFKTVEATPKKN